ncbi:MAG: sulfatase-like hydrolase/transferase [Isosphaeraceae bacterium]
MIQVATERRLRSAVLSRHSTPGSRPYGVVMLVDSFSAPALLLLAVWIGLATGLIEIFALYVRWRVVDATALSSVQLNQHALWMVPLAHAMVFSSCGLLMAVTVKITRGRWAVVISVYGLCFLSVFALLLTYRGLSSLACSVLSGGIAYRISGLILRHGRSIRKLVSYSLPFLIGLVTIFWAVGPSREKIGERSLAKAPPRAPNVLFIVLDTVRAQSLNLYGYARETSPSLVRLARQGVRFDQARATAAWTLPSHASMFTGRWPHELSSRLDRPLDETYPTLAEFLRDRGYDTAGFVANTFFCSRWFGLARGFLHYEDVAVNPIEILRSANLGRAMAKKFAPYQRDRPTAYFDRKDAPTINRELLEWLDHRTAGHPFFAFLNFYDAHDPYLSPEGSTRHFGMTTANPRDHEVLRDWHRINKKHLDRGTIDLARDCYDDCIAELDTDLGDLFTALEERGLLDNTVIVLTADHGEEFGEHGGFGHGQKLHSEVIRVPLLIVAPGRVPTGKSVDVPVTLRDLPATIVDLAGLRDGSCFPGRSMARHWRSSSESNDDQDDPVISEIVDDDGKSLAGAKPTRAIVKDHFVYIRLGEGTEQLFDLSSDPGESSDLRHSPAAERALHQFREDMRQFVQ